MVGSKSRAKRTSVEISNFRLGEEILFTESLKFLNSLSPFSDAMAAMFKLTSLQPGSNHFIGKFDCRHPQRKCPSCR
jgi:hypothetical protein